MRGACDNRREFSISSSGESQNLTTIIVTLNVYHINSNLNHLYGVVSELCQILNDRGDGGHPGYLWHDVVAPPVRHRAGHGRVQHLVPLDHPVAQMD